jgi:hypothetical protein
MNCIKMKVRVVTMTNVSRTSMVTPFFVRKPDRIVSIVSMILTRSLSRARYPVARARTRQGLSQYVRKIILFFFSFFFFKITLRLLGLRTTHFALVSRARGSRERAGEGVYFLSDISVIVKLTSAHNRSQLLVPSSNGTWIVG